MKVTTHHLFAIGLLALATAIACAGDAVPAATAADWARDANAAANANAAQAAETARSMGTWAAWAAGALGILVAVGKFLPGIGGVVANVAGPIYDLVVSKQVRDAENRRDQLAKGFMVAIATIDKLPKEGTIGDLKRKLADRLPSDCRDAVNEWIAEQERERAAAPPPPPAI